MNGNRSTTFLIRIGLVALVIRLAYLIQHVGSVFFGRPLLDQHYYDLCARQLAGAGCQLIDGFRPLLYPLFLSVFYGINLDHGIILSIIVQHLLGVGMAMMVAMLAMRFFDSAKAGFAAGLLFCLSGPPLYFEGELLIASLFSFLLLLLWVAVYQASQSLSLHKAVLLWLLAGIILGFSAQARPNALPLLLIFPIISFFRMATYRHCNGSPHSRALHSVLPSLALIGLILIQFLFGMINARYSGQFSLMTHAGGINFYLGNSIDADGMIPRQDRHVVYEGEYQDPIQLMAFQSYGEATGITRDVSQREVSDYWENRTLEEIKADPVRWMKLMLKKTWLLIWNHEVPNNRSYAFSSQHETPMLNWLPVHWWLLMALFPWGIAELIRKGRQEILVFTTSFIVLFSGTLILFFVNSRFRIPLWPGMAILGGGGATYLWSSLKSRRIPFIPAVCSAILLVLSTINWFRIAPDPIENDLSMRASLFYGQGRYDEALADIGKCIEVAPNNPRYHFTQANILLASERAAAAVEAYLRAIALYPNDPTFHNNLGIAFEKTGELDKAEIAYRNALALHPGLSTATVNLMLLSIQRGDLKAARSVFEQIPEDVLNNTALCASAVLQYLESGDAEALENARSLDASLTEQLIQHKPSSESP